MNRSARIYFAILFALGPRLLAQTWTDPATGIIWDSHDNGSDINWSGAQSYCSSRGPGWTLPDIDELAAMYDPQATGMIVHRIKGGIQLTGWPWSASRGVYFHFVYGYRQADSAGASLNNRALCVRRDEAKLPVWIDAATGLLWAKRDSGSNVHWQEAQNYCTNFTAGPYQRWRLPQLQELQKLYAPGVNRKCTFAGKTLTCHLQAPIEITGFEWSATPDGSADAMVFNFTSGIKAPFPTSLAMDRRALCVRSPAEQGERPPVEQTRHEHVPTKP